jgi:hypothetical protein
VPHVVHSTARLDEVFKRELTIVGSYAQALNIGRAVACLENLPKIGLITHWFRLGECGAPGTPGSPAGIAEPGYPPADN